MTFLAVVGLTPAVSALPAVALPPAEVEGNPLEQAVETVYHMGVVCGFQPATFQCQQLTGHYGTGAIRWCKATPYFPHALARLPYDGFAAADSATRATGVPAALPVPYTGMGVCTGAFDVLNATASLGPTL